MKASPTYGPAAKNHALTLLSQGWTAEQIRAVDVCSDIPSETLRSWKHRMESKANATKPQHKAASETAVQRDATPATAEQPAENAPKTDKKAGFLREFGRAFHPADLLYYCCVAIAGAGFVQALQAIGYAVAGIFFCVALLALHFVKVRNGWARLPHLLALALVEIGGFVAHLSWANGRLWSNIQSLPLDIWVNKYRNDMGEVVMLYGGTDVDKPFYIAAAISGVMLFCGVYVVTIAIQNAPKNEP